MGIKTENTKAFMFARYMSMCYADSESFGGGPSVLNSEDGKWWKDKLVHFNKVVYPNYIKNGSVNSTNKFLKDIL